MKSTRQCGVPCSQCSFPRPHPLDFTVCWSSPQSTNPSIQHLSILSSTTSSPCPGQRQSTVISFPFRPFLNCQLTPGEFLFLYIFLSFISLSTPSLSPFPLRRPRGSYRVFLALVPGTLSKVRSAARFPRLFCVLCLCLWSMLVSLSFFRCLPGLLVNEEEKVSWPLLFTLVVLVGIDVDVVVGCLVRRQFGAPTTMALFSILSIP